MSARAKSFLRVSARAKSSPSISLLPGVALCVAVTLAARGLQAAEEALFGRAWLESLVLAILLGTALRSAWVPGPRWRPGIAFSAKTLLEVAVVLLGASISVAAVVAAGPALIGAVAAVVVGALAWGYGLGRAFGLPPRMAILVASGNAICGNSAIAAVAPVIGAEAKDVASAIAFTAVLGVAVVLGLPLAVAAFGLTQTQYGTLAGLTVYAVPQVLAATLPVGALAGQVGTLVKLVRVLMLGPVVLGLSLFGRRLREEPTGALAAGDRPVRARVRASQLVPPFILGFIALAALRAAGLLPEALVSPLATLAGLLTVVAMAALGLGVDVRTVARAGLPVTATVVLSLALLGGVSLALIRLLGVA